MTEQIITGANRGPRFQFVVVADTHVNEGERISTSPYVSDHLATPRTRHVFAEIAAMDPPPRFVVHLGDIVHPVPSLPEGAGCGGTLQGDRVAARGAPAPHPRQP